MDAAFLVNITEACMEIKLITYHCRNKDFELHNYLSHACKFSMSQKKIHTVGAGINFIPSKTLELA